MKPPKGLLLNESGRRLERSCSASGYIQNCEFPCFHTSKRLQTDLFVGFRYCMPNKSAWLFVGFRGIYQGVRRTVSEAIHASSDSLPATPDVHSVNKVFNLASTPTGGIARERWQCTLHIETHEGCTSYSSSRQEPHTKMNPDIAHPQSGAGPASRANPSKKSPRNFCREPSCVLSCHIQ